MSKSAQRIYPTHTNEALFFWQMRQESVIEAIQELCAQYCRQYNRLPDLVFVNTFLIDKFDKEVAEANGRKTMCIEPEDVIWFYCSPEHAQVLLEAQFIVVAHSQLSGATCSI